MAWDRTHGPNVDGAYLRHGVNELYVRPRKLTAGKPAGWIWYLDGVLMGAGDSEAVAKAAGEAAVRSMSRTHTGRMAAAAG